MEIILGLAVLAGLAYWFIFRDKETVKEAMSAEDAPYKVEAPKVDFELPKMDEPRRCGCGRSSTGFCVGLHALSAAEWAENDANPHKAAKPKAPKKPKVVKSDATAKPKASKAKPKAPAMKVVKGDSGKKAPAKTKKSGK